MKRRAKLVFNGNFLLVQGVKDGRIALSRVLVVVNVEFDNSTILANTVIERDPSLARTGSNPVEFVRCDVREKLRF